MDYSKRGFLFTGCSYSYGYGLGHYHKDYPRPFTERTYEFDEDFPNKSVYADFQIKQRFSNKVVNHYNSFSKQYGGISGCDLVSIEWLNEVLGFQNNLDILEGENLRSSLNNTPENSFLEDYHTLIFQTSYIDRNLAGVWKEIKNQNDGTYFDSKEECCEFHNTMELGAHSQLVNIIADTIIDISKTFENLGINVYFIHATDVYKDIPYIMDRTIHITHKETTSLTINKIMKDYSETCIGTDPIFGTNPPNDFHPSLECHNSIYKSIVNKLNESNPL